MSGFYDARKWVPIGVGLLVVASAAAIARPPRLSRPAAGRSVSMGLAATWALVSSAWAPSIEQATIDGNRMFVLAAILATALVLVRTDLTAAWLAARSSPGIAAVAAYVIACLLGSDPSTLLLGGRLNQPLGYTTPRGQSSSWGSGCASRWSSAGVAGSPGLAPGGHAVAALTLMTQSRGAALATFVSLVVVVALVPGDRLRRVLGLATCGAIVAAAAPRLLDVYDTSQVGIVPLGVGHKAGVALLVAAVAAGLVWAARVTVQALFATARPTLVAPLRRAGVGLLAAGAVVFAGVSIVSAGSIEHNVSNQWTSFTSLGARTARPRPARATGSCRAAGTRYDYWRVAWIAFATTRSVGLAPATTTARTSRIAARPRTSASRTRSRCRRSRSSGRGQRVLLAALPRRVRRRRMAHAHAPPPVAADHAVMIAAWASSPPGSSTRASTGST